MIGRPDATVSRSVMRVMRGQACNSAISISLTLYRFVNMTKLAFSILLLFSFCCFGRTQTATPSPIPTVEFCDLVRNAANYDGKPVRLRAAYFSAFEISGLGGPAGGPSCLFGDKTMVWVDFDSSVESVSKPEIYKRFLDSIYAQRVVVKGNIASIEGEWLFWETPVVFIGVIHKPNGRG